MSSKYFRDVDTVAERRKALRQTTDLSDGEVMLWQDRPKRGIVFTGIDVFLVPFSFFWASAIFELFSGTTKVWRGELGIMALFIVVAAYFTVGRFIIDAYYRSGMRYIITNQRVIIAKKRFGASVKSFDLKSLKLSMTELSDGSGTVGLTGEWSDPFFALGSNWLISQAQAPILFRIKSVREVYELLRKAHADAQSNTSRDSHHPG